MTPAVPLGPGNEPAGAVAVSVQAVGSKLPCTDLSKVNLETHVTLFVIVYELVPAAKVTLNGNMASTGARSPA